MSQQTNGTTIQGTESDRLMGDQRYTVPATAHVSTHPTGGGGDMVEVKNRVQFGPIIAGVLTAITTLLILTVLGLAIGTSALEPRDAGEGLGIGAAIWGILSALIAFFLGGWVAAKTAAVAGAGSGMINGLMVGAAIIALVLWLTGTGVSNILGTLGSNIGDITNAAQSQGTSATDVQQQVQDQAASVDVDSAFDTVKNGAWGTLAGLVLPLIASALGGLLGHNKQHDVMQRTAAMGQGNSRLI